MVFSQILETSVIVGLMSQILCLTILFTVCIFQFVVRMSVVSTW